LLLAAIIVAFAIQGVAEPGKLEEILVAILLGATLLLALWVADSKPRVMGPAALIVTALILTSIVEAVNGNVAGGATRIANALLVGLAPPAIVIGVMRSLRSREAVTLEAVFGVLCVYILLGMFFASLYGTIDRFGGDPFFAGGQSATVARCLYFSFASLTTAGYGDFTARTNLGHTLSVSEALLGQIYLVTVVSLIVANLGRSRPAARRE
jgi:ion channel